MHKYRTDITNVYVYWKNTEELLWKGQAAPNDVTKQFQSSGARVVSERTTHCNDRQVILGIWR